MDNKDFFDEEFDKVEEQNKRSQNNADPFNTWNYEPRQNATTTKTSHKKAWFISLTCLTIVLCFVAGWVLCYVFGGTQTASNGESYYLGILQQVMHAIDNDLYVTDMSKYVDANGNWDQSAYNAAAIIIRNFFRRLWVYYLQHFVNIFISVFFCQIIC